MADAVEFESKELEIEDGTMPLNRFAPIKMLGQGSLGCVYLCLDKHLNKNVAVKCLVSITDDKVVAFQNEAKIASRLNHEGVIKILDFGVTDNARPFMVMEHFAGTSLEDVLEKNGALSQTDAIELALQICGALQYLHDNGVFHRDLKPSNILVGRKSNGDFAVRLIDFNLSKTTQDIQSSTIVQGRTVVGTPSYMSPDQVAGLAYNAASEVYSMGCVFFEMLTGQTVFSGETSLEIVNQHANTQAPLPSSVVPDINLELDQISERCLSKSRDARYSSMNELIDDLHRAQKRLSPHSETTALIGGETRNDNQAKSNPQLMLLYLLLAIVVVGVPVSILFVLSKPADDSIEVTSTTSKIAYDPWVNQHKIALEVSDARLSAKRQMKRGRESIKLAITCADDDLEIFEHNQTITDINVADSPITDEGLLHLVDMPKLVKLNLDSTNLKTLNTIGQVKHLKLLTLERTGLTDECLLHLRELKELENLDIAHNHFTDKAIANLAGVEKLEYIDLSDNPKMRIEFAPAVKQMKSLRFLVLNKMPNLTFEKARELVNARSDLVGLDVQGNNQISQDQIEKLESEFPTTRFIVARRSLYERTQEVADTFFNAKKYALAENDYKQCLNLVHHKSAFPTQVEYCKTRIEQCRRGMTDNPE